MPVVITQEEKALPYAKYFYQDLAPIPQEKLDIWQSINRNLVFLQNIWMATRQSKFQWWMELQSCMENMKFRFGLCWACLR